MSLQIRLAQQRDIAHLMAVERSAAQLFRQQPEWRFIAEGEVMARSSMPRLLPNAVNGWRKATTASAPVLSPCRFRGRLAHRRIVGRRHGSGRASAVA